MGKRAAYIVLALRTTQVDYLAYLGRWEDKSTSQVLDSILERHVSRADGPLTTRPRVAKAERKHVAIDPAHKAYLDRLSVEWGIGRSEVVRRLIDMERAQEMATA